MIHKETRSYNEQSFRNLASLILAFEYEEKLIGTIPFALHTTRKIYQTFAYVNIYK